MEGYLIAYCTSDSTGCFTLTKQSTPLSVPKIFFCTLEEGYLHIALAKNEPTDVCVIQLTGHQVVVNNLMEFSKNDGYSCCFRLETTPSMLQNGYQTYLEDRVQIYDFHAPSIELCRQWCDQIQDWNRSYFHAPSLPLNNETEQINDLKCILAVMASSCGFQDNLSVLMNDLENGRRYTYAGGRSHDQNVTNNCFNRRRRHRNILKNSKWKEPGSDTFEDCGKFIEKGIDNSNEHNHLTERKSIAGSVMKNKYPPTAHSNPWWQVPVIKQNRLSTGYSRRSMQY